MPNWENIFSDKQPSQCLVYSKHQSESKRNILHPKYSTEMTNELDCDIQSMLTSTGDGMDRDGKAITYSALL